VAAGRHGGFPHANTNTTVTGFGRLGSGWQRFWFEPQETSSLALFRIAFGLVATAWTATLIPNLFAFFGPGGILPADPARDTGEWSVLALSTNPALVIVMFAATLGAAVALTIGSHTRIAAVVLWIGIVSFEQRNVLVTNSGDGVVRDLAFLCMLAPSGTALSIDRFRQAHARFWEFPARAPWALRLIQIQISIGYLSAVWHKSHNALWTNGTAVSYALRMQDIHRLATPAFVTHSVTLVNLLTYGTLAIEFSLGVLVWNRAARPWVLALGVVMHLGIDSSILVGYFSYAMLAGYLAFVPPETASRYIVATRDGITRLADRLTGQRRTPTSPVPQFIPRPPPRAETGCTRNAGNPSAPAHRSPR
jgi:hypothetical protein